MPYISLPPGMPGMMALSAYRPDVYTRLASLADLLLQQQHPSSTLTPGERELIASYVSALNQCAYCATIHGAVAAAHLHDPQLVDDVKCSKHDEAISAAVSPKMKALLGIAALVTRSGREVTPEAVRGAVEMGATEMDVHDVVLIAATFCLFNRYVDGLGTEMPRDMEAFVARGPVIAQRGYAGMVPVQATAAGAGVGAGVAVGDVETKGGVKTD